jgi:hypothetical protein
MSCIFRVSLGMGHLQFFLRDSAEWQPGPASRVRSLRATLRGYTVPPQPPVPSPESRIPSPESRIPSLSKPTLEPRRSVKRIIAHFPTGRKKFYKLGTRFPTGRKAGASGARFSKDRSKILRARRLPKARVGASRRGGAATRGVTWPSWPCPRTGETPVPRRRGMVRRRNQTRLVGAGLDLPEGTPWRAPANDCTQRSASPVTGRF